MQLSQQEVQLLVDLFIAGDMADRSERKIKEEPEKHLLSLVFALIDEAKEEGSTVSFSLLGALLQKNLEKAEKFLQEELVAKQ